MRQMNDDRQMSRMSEPQSPSGKRAIATHAWRVLAVAWIGLIVIYFLVEGWRYNGLYASLAEWQFARFGRQWPIATYCFLVLLFSIPALILSTIKPRRLPAQTEGLHDEEREYDPHALRLSKAASRQYVLFSLASVLIFATLLILALTLFLPQAQKVSATVALQSTSNQVLHEGPARLSGRILQSHIATSKSDLFTKGVDSRFAPLLPVDGRGPVHVFVELLPDEVFEGDQPLVDLTGILVNNALPGPIDTLYRGSKMPIANNPSVLFRSRATMVRPYYQIAQQVGIAALLMLIVAFFDRRRYRHLSKSPIMKKEASGPPA